MGLGPVAGDDLDGQWDGLVCQQEGGLDTVQVNREMPWRCPKWAMESEWEDGAACPKLLILPHPHRYKKKMTVWH